MPAIADAKRLAQRERRSEIGASRGTDRGLAAIRPTGLHRAARGLRAGTADPSQAHYSVQFPKRNWHDGRVPISERIEAGRRSGDS
jgi:hypothetical protein